MTMKLFIKNDTQSCGVDAWVHEYHENDMVSFLMNHPKKTNVTNVTPHHDGVEWFKIVLTSEDVESIKETSWYHNTKSGAKELDKWIVQGATIEVISIVSLLNKG